MFRFSRIAAFAVCVALSLLVAVSAQSNDPLASTPQKFKHKLKIVSKYNSSSDTTAISFFLKQPDGLARLAGSPASTEFGEDVGIAVSFSYSGKQLAQPVDEALMWIAYTGRPRAAVTSELSALVDGQELVLSRQVGGSPNRPKDNKIGSLTVSVARTRLTQLANASRVELLLPSGEHIKLNREQLSALADFTSRMSP